jgi:hypothetical protein
MAKKIVSKAPKRSSRPSVKWMGPAPQSCEVCSQPITDTFVDGKTHMGPWANMCSGCHKHHGTGLGMGKGQQYKKQPNGDWVKVKG